MKYLKANNLYNHSLDNTYSNSKLNQKNISNLNSINSINLQEISNIFPCDVSNFNMTNYGYSLDIKKQILFRNQNKIRKKKFLKTKFFDDLLRTYNNILTERPPFKKTINLNLKKYFPQKMNNLTIDILLKDTKRKGLAKMNYKKIILKNRKILEINSNSKEKRCLTSQNSLKNIKSPKNIEKINTIKNKFEIKKKNLWNIKINLDKNSKIKIAKYMKQNNLSKINHKKISSEIIKIKNIFSLTKKGFWQPETEKPNQDNFFIFKNITSESNNYFIGVCDGHGKYGKEISSFISINLPLNLKQNFLDNKIKINKESLSTITKIITKTFIQTNLSLNLNSNIGTSSSGSTCSSIILTPYRLISINLGDSRCVLGKYNNKWSYVNLTRDHKPKEEDEKKRILEKGGKISKEKAQFDNKIGITRIWKKNGGNIGLALTRSFGDEILSKVGIICEPEIKEFILYKNDKFIIIGTDGLWEYIY
jgi:serine/threonine protein phosphatase PrpC